MLIASLVIAGCAAAGTCALSLLFLRHLRHEAERPRIAPAPAYDDTAVRTALDQLEQAVGAQAIAEGGLRKQLADLEAELRQVYLAVDEGIKHVDRSERRVRGTVARAQKRLEAAGFADEGLDAEAEGLRLVDGGSGEEEGLPPVSENVADPGDGPSSVPGVSISELQRVRGL